MAAGSISHSNLEGTLAEIRAGRAAPCHLPLQFLKDITANFSNERVLGRGGFGVVYKGILSNGEIVAVKRLLHGPQVVDRQFQNEAHVLNLMHENIVRFLGYCTGISQVLCEDSDGKERVGIMQEKLLCLEFMPNGSLDNHITDASSGLNWNQRYDIIKGICRGICFLNEENRTNTPVIHTDLKPANILLTDKLVPKITDFGLSRLFGEQSKEYTRSSGTRGYMAPEFVDRGRITMKTDIFSLGVIILEVITGERDYPLNRTGSTLPKDYANYAAREVQLWRTQLEASRSIRTDFYCQQINGCIDIGLRCLKENDKERPRARDIIDSLNRLDMHSDPRNIIGSLNRMNIHSDPSTCAGCNRRFGNEGKLIAMGSNWHHRCFKCFKCNNPIPHNSQFFEKDEKPYHEICYRRAYLTCAICNNLIPAGSDGKYHHRPGPHCMSHGR